jgi:hypothetical protein
MAFAEELCCAVETDIEGAGSLTWSCLVDNHGVQAVPGSAGDQIVGRLI